MDSDQSARLLLFGVTAAVLIAAAAFLAVGYYVSVIQPRGRTVLEVEGIKVSYAAMKRRMQHEYYSNVSFQDVNVVELVPRIALGNLLEELTLTTKAESSLGITVDAAMIEAQERVAAGVGPEADEATFATAYREALSESRLNDSEFRRLVRAQAIEAAVRAKLNESTPAAVEQAKVEVITTDDIETAQQALARVRAGEAWATVATELSTDPNAVTTGGVKDYAFNGQSTTAYSDFAFSAPIGEISEPLQNPNVSAQFFVVRIVDRSPQPLTPGQKTPYEDKQYEKWISDTQATMAITDKWTSDQDAQVDANSPLVRDAIEKYRELQEQLARPTPTTDPAVAQTAAAGSTAAAETQVASGTPAATTPTQTTAEATPVTTGPVATGTANGQ